MYYLYKFYFSHGSTSYNLQKFILIKRIYLKNCNAVGINYKEYCPVLSSLLTYILYPKKIVILGRFSSK